MRQIAIAATACFFLVLGAAGATAMGMGGEGGPSDAWGSPYALYVPQAVTPPAWTQSRTTHVDPDNRFNCHGDRACERRKDKGAHSSVPQ